MNIDNRSFPIALGIFLCGCGASGLSRSGAEELLAKSPQLNSPVTTIPFHTGGKSAWDEQGGPYSTKTQGQFTNPTELGLTLTKSATRRVREITGIVDAPLVLGVKEVQFSWTYEPLPSLARRYLVTGGVGKASFRKYDDGWRLESVDELEDSAETPTFSAAELADIAKDISTEKDRREGVERRRAELQGIVQASMRPSGVVASMALQSLQPNKSATVTITDVNFTYNIEADSYSQSPETVWFGAVDSIYLRGPSPSSTIFIQRTPPRGSLMGSIIVLPFSTDSDREKAYSAMIAALRAFLAKYASDLDQARSLGVVF